MKIKVYFDGLCEPKNPGGVAAGGWIVERWDEHGGHVDLTRDSKVFHDGGSLATNNVAEWLSLGNGLRWVFDNVKEPIEELYILGDSQLVIRQITREYACRAEHLQKYLARCDELIARIDAKRFYPCWIPRDQNNEADALSREAYEKHTGKLCPERIKR